MKGSLIEYVFIPLCTLGYAALNRLDGVFYHKKLTIRGLERVETYLKSADVAVSLLV